MARMDETYFKTYYPVFKPPGETTDMTHQILTETAASISELKANPMKVVASGKGMPVVVLNRNEPAFACAALMDLVDDAELLKLVQKRQHESSIKVTLDAL